MCRHEWFRYNDLKICRRCGLTVCPDGRAFFDRALPGLLKRYKRHAKNG